MHEPLIFEVSRKGRRAVDFFPDENKELLDSNIPAKYLRENEAPGLPELSEVDVMRHFTRISSWNFHVDANFYPLGSCTMKYNPRINEALASQKELLFSHPAQNEEDIQGSLRILWESQELLARLSGMEAVSLQPSAGAQGELTALLMFRAYHRKLKQHETRKFILIPDSAHGTNPASANIAGFKVKSFASAANGLVDFKEFKKTVDEVGLEQVAGAMVTNPNTLGMFEPEIRKLADLLHEIGGLLYIDGANFNAILGKTTFGLMGADAVHFNLHKTFSSPHGGGGPGAGPVAVSQRLIPFLPAPIVAKEQNTDGTERYFFSEPAESIGKVKSFHGNFLVIVKSLAYIKSMGKENIPEIANRAVLNANYIKKRLEPYLANLFPGDNMHEIVFSDRELKKDYDISALDIAKALLDYGFHAPTIYFPLIVTGALMMEPTETESKDTLDAYCDAVIEIIEKGKKEKGVLHSFPQRQRVGRLDETTAARNPVLRWQ